MGRCDLLFRDRKKPKTSNLERGGERRNCRGGSESYSTPRDPLPFLYRGGEIHHRAPPNV